MPQKDSPDYRAAALAKWEQTYKNKVILEQDTTALRQLLKETQVAQLALLLENEQLKKQRGGTDNSSVQTLHAILEALPHAIYIKDVQDDYKILYWNAYASRLLDSREEQGVGKTDYELFPKTRAHSFRRSDRDAVEQSLEQNHAIIRNQFCPEGLQRSVIKDATGEPRFLIGLSTGHPKLEQLIQKEQKIKAIFDSSDDAILLFVDGQFFDCNVRALDLYQVPNKGAFTKMSLLDVSPTYQPNGKASETLAKEYWQTLKEKGICRFYWLHQCQASKSFHADVVVSIIPYKDEEIIRVVVRDVSERIREQSEMHKLSLLVQKTNNTVVILNEAAEIEWANEGFEKMTGYDAKVVVGEHFGALLASPQSNEAQFKLPTEKKAPNDPSRLYELEGCKKNGDSYVRLTAITPFVDLEGRRRFMVIESDVTTERQATENESPSTTEAPSILKEALGPQVGHWSHNGIEQTAYWSEDLYTLLGYEEGEIAPNRDTRLAHIHSGDHAEVRAAYKQLLKDQEPYSIRYRITPKHGGWLTVQEYCVGNFDENGKLVHSTGIIQPIINQKEHKNALKKSVQQAPSIQYALDQSSMVLVLDTNYCILSANDLFCRTTQYAESELIGHPFDMTDPDYHSRWFLNLMWETVGNGEVWKGELKSKTKLGTNYWTDTVIVPIKDDEGENQQYIILQHDISSKKVVEEEVEQINEAEFAKLYRQQQHYIAEIEERSAEWERYFQISIEMIAVFDYGGALSRTNPAFSKSLGYSPKELYGQHFSKFVHKDDLAETYLQYENLKDGREVVGFENRWRNYNGEYLWMSWQAIMDRETKCLYCVSRDITSEKNAQSRIKDFTHTLNQTTSVIVLDRERRVNSVNQKFCEISGYQQKEVVGEPYSILRSDYHDKVFWKNILTRIKMGKIWQGEICEQTKNGRTYWTYTSIVPFSNQQGIPFQYIVTQSDITNRKNLEDKLREAKKEADKNAKIKEDFLANMSHEIRTPMNGVLGFSRLLLQTDMNTVQHEYAQSIYSSAENLLVIVNDILDVSKIESGTFQLHEIPFNLKKRMEEGLSILKVSVQRKNLDFSIDIDEAIPPIIMGVPDRLSQILINLVGNAIKFTKKGYVKLSVTVKNNYLIFRVKDSGIGIPADKLDTIFESFTQAENYTTREYSGTGLGLSISRKLVNVMGGQIGVESVLGEGSTFYFTLPYHEADTTTTIAEALSDEAVDTDEVPLILIVEDNKVNQELTQIYLNLLECNYHIAYNGEEALECIQKNDYDLILMDIQMPKMDGMAATGAIRKINDHVPILAMSAHALERERERCFEIGMNDYIAKPFKVEALKTILEKFIVLPAQKVHAAQPRVQHLDSNELKEDLARNKFLKTTEASISRELLYLFKQELHSLQEGMEVALLAANLDAVQRLMHKIKSNFRLLDLMKFYRWSDEIDQLATQEAPIEEIEHLYQQFKEALPALLEQIEYEIKA